MLKKNAKRTIVDALLMFYGAVKCGWGNEQGNVGMGLEGIPPSVREDIHNDLAYAIRLKPWDVIVDMEDFANPAWIACRYVVKPEQLQKDTRLSHREQIEGKSQVDLSYTDRRSNFRAANKPRKEDLKRTEYFEVHVKPCAEYPKGLYFILTDEVKKDFLYFGEWPVDATEFPIKLLYFDEDPDGGLPMPGMRYIANHQKAKLNLRNAEYEFVQRTMPALGINTSSVNNDTLKKQLSSGQIPRVVTFNGPIGRGAVAPISWPSISGDYRGIETNVDNDISQMVGMVGPVNPAQRDEQLATGLKMANRDEQVRQSEKADIVSDFIQGIVEYWSKLYKQFAGPENYTEIEGETFPVKWDREMINGKFKFKLKPFSMNYEDPLVKRKQYMDLLNLAGSPELRVALKEQGADTDIVKIFKRVLETFDERDTESFLIDQMSKPEEQVARALQENLEAQQGVPPQIQPTDNHKLHIMIHGILGDLLLEHIKEHAAALQEGVTGGTAGGGNPEGSPVNGVAINQDLLKGADVPSPINQNIAINRESGSV